MKSAEVEFCSLCFEVRLEDTRNQNWLSLIQE